MLSRFLVGLDIGTSSIKVAVAERRGQKIALRALFKEPSLGLRKGVLYDLAETVPAMSRSLEAVKKLSRQALRNVYINIGTPQIKVQHSRGIIAVARADNEIYADDIERAIKASEAVSVSPNRLVIHNVTKEYIVDGVADILDPLGLTGTRLEVSSLVIDAFVPHV
ncbi:MAG: cell division protein FtsA, partial [bacterium]|nr:cell division protein FtsA [bacterium]